MKLTLDKGEGQHWNSKPGNLYSKARWVTLGAMPNVQLALSATYDGFRETPPDPNLKPDYSDRFHLAAYNRIQHAAYYQFYKDSGAVIPACAARRSPASDPYWDGS